MLKRVRALVLLNIAIAGMAAVVLASPRPALATEQPSCEHKQCNGTRSCEFGAGLSCDPDPIGGVECTTKYCWDTQS